MNHNNVHNLDRERKKRELIDLVKQYAVPTPENYSNWPTSVIQSVINSIQNKKDM